VPRPRDRLLPPLLVLAVLCLACGVGATEQTDDEAVEPTVPEPVPPTPPPPAEEEPRIIGTRHLAHFNSTGFAYAAVVTGTFDADRLGVVYADGDTERLERGDLYPDQIGVGSRVEARIRQWDRFFPGRITQRVAHAVFVEFDDGDRQWTSIGLVRAPVGELSRTADEAPHPDPTGTPPAPGSGALANYHGQGWYYPAVVVDARDDTVHVIYADGDSEWLATSQVRPDTIGPDTVCQAQRRGQAQPVEGRVVRRVGHAIELRLDDGSKAWFALSRVRVR